MGNYIKRFAFWNPGTWSIPTLYWDAFSEEQRIHAICKQLGKVIAYADYLGINVDDIAARLQAIEEGQLDPIIIAAIEEWFEEHQAEILSEISDLENALPITDYAPDNTVSDRFAVIEGKFPITDIADNAVTANKIANNAVTANKIADNAVTGSKLADDAVDTAEIKNNAVTYAKLSSDVRSAIDRNLSTKMLIIGDSYSSHSSNQQFTATWPAKVANSLGLSLTNLAVPGDGFVNNNGFLTQLATATALADKDKYGVIIVYGGVNDVNTNANLTTFRTNATTVINTLNTNFPNAKIYLCGINAGITNFNSTANQIKLETYLEVLRNIPKDRKNCVFIDTTKWLLCGESMYAADNLHPHDTNGNVALAYSFVNMVHGVDAPFYTIVDPVNLEVTDANEIALQAILDKPYRVCNGVAHITSSVKDISLTSPIQITGTIKELPGIPSSVIGARDCLTAYLFRKIDSIVYPVLLSITNGKITVAMPSGISTLGGDYRMFVPATELQIYS